jgi:hypothetical protein
MWKESINGLSEMRNRALQEISSRKCILVAVILQQQEEEFEKRKCNKIMAELAGAGSQPAKDN